MPRRTPYTVVGGPRNGRLTKYTSRFTIIVINREGKLYRDEFLGRFHNHPVAEVLYVDGPSGSYDIEAMSRKYARVRFLLVKEPTSVGETINLAVEESRSPQTLVMWSNMDVDSALLNTPLFDRLALENALCIVPRLTSEGGEELPSVTMPVFVRRKARVIPLDEPDHRSMCLYPFDFAAVYNRERFLRVGGFDPSILNPYWQKLDFGFRSLMWDERIVYTRDFSLRYGGKHEAEDTTRDTSYKTFFLKNIAVRIRGDGGVIPAPAAIPYMLRSDTGPLASLSEFRNARRWVRANKDRFRREARTLADLWELPE